MGDDEKVKKEDKKKRKSIAGKIFLSVFEKFAKLWRLSQTPKQFSWLSAEFPFFSDISRIIAATAICVMPSIQSIETRVVCSWHII